MKILITGSDGFIAKNLILRLQEFGKHEILTFNKSKSAADLSLLVDSVEFIFHLAGVNRPQDPAEFQSGNAGLTSEICRILDKKSHPTPVLFTSSTQASLNNPYGMSKKSAEDALLGLEKNPVYIFRLPNVFGKWAKPNYNSAVATFCYNIANNLPIQIHDPDAPLRLAYVDDVIDDFLAVMESPKGAIARRGFCEVTTVYDLTVGQLAEKIKDICAGRETLVTAPVGTGIDRALHATYLSYYRPEQFSYELPRYSDPRGVFVEFLKTNNSGQMSFFTALPGITRGGHYHHTKTEKFLVIQGVAKFGFRHMVTNEKFELVVDSSQVSKVIETVPGWTHDITNVGTDLMIVMLWANEIFDREKPDTIGCKV